MIIIILRGILQRNTTSRRRPLFRRKGPAAAGKSEEKSRAVLILFCSWLGEEKDATFSLEEKKKGKKRG